MKNCIYLAAIVIVWMIVGCAQNRPQLTRDQFLEISIKKYTGIDKEKIFKACEEIFRLSDGNDYSFTYTENSMKANRFYNVYMVLSTAQGNFIWDIKTIEKDSDTIVKVAVEQHAGGFLSPTFSQTINSPAVYDLFFKRLDYMLGFSNEWLTCNQYDEKYNDKNKLWGSLEAFCFVTDDKMLSRREHSFWSCSHRSVQY